MKNILSLTFLFILLNVVSVSCSNDDDIKGTIWGSEWVYGFTDNPDTENRMDTISLNDSKQTLTLGVKKLLQTGFPMPKELFLTIEEWDSNNNKWVTNLSNNVSDIEGSFYHVSSETENGSSLIKVELEANETSLNRKIKIHACSDPINHILPYGDIEITQNTSNQSFALKARYKGRDYFTIAEIDHEGNFLYQNEEYAQLMKEIDIDPSIQMVIMDDSTIHYYDSEDITNNLPYEDIRSLSINNSASFLSTRADGFEYQESEDLGFMAIYDNDHFAGKMHYKGLTNFHFTYNIPSLKPMDLNDKITSIAVGYNGDDPIVCTVLTIWDDTDYNHGDDNRKKHRISIVASQNSPRVSLPDLKQIKKIGSSKSWNDCISCFSLHFGYTDRFLLDY